MLTREDRTSVENIRRARTIKIVVNEGSDDEYAVKITRYNTATAKLIHYIALAFQDFFNNARRYILDERPSWPAQERRWNHGN